MPICCQSYASESYFHKTDDTESSRYTYEADKDGVNIEKVLAANLNQEGYQKIIIRGNDKMPLSKRISKEKALYVIECDVDLQNEKIELPAGCALCFSAGSIRNGTIVGNPSIIANDIQIFHNIVTDISEVKAEWIGVSSHGNAIANRVNLDFFIKNHKAVNTVDGNRLSVLFPQCLTYEFDSGIVLPDNIFLYFEGATALKDQMTMLKCQKRGATFFTVMGGQFCASNISFGGASGSSYDYAASDCTVLIDYKKTTDKSPKEGYNDTDAKLYNCRFRTSNIGVRLTGRQSKIKSCVFSDCNVGVLIDDLTNPNQKVYGSSRNNHVSDCHFHSSIIVAVWCKGKYQRHLVIDNNNMDMAAGCFFKGYLRSGFVYNNSIQYTVNTLGLKEVNIFDLDCLENSFITGNKCDYANDLVYDGIKYPNKCNTFVKCKGAVDNSDITNNKFGESLDYGFVFDSTVSGLCIKNNSIVSSCTSSKYNRDLNQSNKSRKNAYVVKFNRDTIERVVIEGNTQLGNNQILIYEINKFDNQRDDEKKNDIPRFGPTSKRPKGSLVYIGYQYFDTTLKKPIWYSGSNVWVDYTGEEM